MTRLTRIETVVFLHGVDFFSSCTAEQILRISAIARQDRLAAGERIYAPGEPAERLYCLVSGEVQVGNRPIGPRQTFGVIEILSGRLRAEEAVAQQDSLVLAIDAEDFFDLLANNIEIVKALFRQLLKRPEELAGKVGA